MIYSKTERDPIVQRAETLSNRCIAIQRISVNKEYCTIHKMEIYTVVIVIEQSGPGGQQLASRVILTTRATYS